MASARPILVDAGALQNSPQYFMAVLVLDTLSWSLTSFPFLQRAAAPLLPLVFRTSTSPFTSPLRPEENQGQGSLRAPMATKESPATATGIHLLSYNRWLQQQYLWAFEDASINST